MSEAPRDGTIVVLMGPFVEVGHCCVGRAHGEHWRILGHHHEHGIAPIVVTEDMFTGWHPITALADEHYRRLAERLL